MSEAAEYRRYAQMCVENAEIAPSEGDRTALLSLARHWLQLASKAEGRQPELQIPATIDGAMEQAGGSKDSRPDGNPRS
jgi:hypothetical protein